MKNFEELPDVTRVEVVDQKGRSYVNWKDTNFVQLSLQDDGRTLKVFIGEKKKKPISTEKNEE